MEVFNEVIIHRRAPAKAPLPTTKGSYIMIWLCKLVEREWKFVPKSPKGPEHLNKNVSP